MALGIGIVGLPNVGKSTLFNALSSAGAQAANYPFCTIEPNVGVVPVPDERLDQLSADEHKQLRELFLLTDKPVLYVATIGESQLGKEDSDPHVAAVRDLAKEEGAEMVALAAGIEAEIQQLSPEERPGFLASVGLSEPGLHKVVRAGYRMLGLQTFFTVGEQECRAWTFHKGAKAPEAAGVIHSDFERGFIKAEVFDWKDLIRLGSEAAVREKGLLRIEGKEYVVRDGDCMHFRFNV